MIYLLTLYVVVLLVSAGGLVAMLRGLRRRRRAAAHARFVKQFEAWLGEHGTKLTPWQRDFLLEIYKPERDGLIKRFALGQTRRQR